MCKVRRKYINATYNECMWDARSNSYKQHVLACKHIYANKFIMITFPEKLPMGVSFCVADKHM